MEILGDEVEKEAQLRVPGPLGELFGPWVDLSQEEGVSSWVSQLFFARNFSEKSFPFKITVQY